MRNMDWTNIFQISPIGVGMGIRSMSTCVEKGISYILEFHENHRGGSVVLWEEDHHDWTEKHERSYETISSAHTAFKRALQESPMEWLENH